MRIHHPTLKKKGWSDEEISHLHDSVLAAEEQKHPAYKFLEVAVFWGLLFLTLIGVFLVSLILIPLLLTLPDSISLVILAILGFCLGSLFALVLSDIEWLERRHHIFNLLILMVVAVLNIWFIVTRVDALDGSESSPLLFALIFTFMLIAPYLFHLVTVWRLRR